MAITCAAINSYLDQFKIENNNYLLKSLGVFYFFLFFDSKKALVRDRLRLRERYAKLLRIVLGSFTSYKFASFSFSSAFITEQVQGKQQNQVHQSLKSQLL